MLGDRRSSTIRLPGLFTVGTSDAPAVDAARQAEGPKRSWRGVRGALLAVADRFQRVWARLPLGPVTALKHICNGHFSRLSRMSRC